MGKNILLNFKNVKTTLHFWKNLILIKMYNLLSYIAEFRLLISYLRYFSLYFLEVLNLISFFCGYLRNDRVHVQLKNLKLISIVTSLLNNARTLSALFTATTFSSLFAVVHYFSSLSFFFWFRPTKQTRNKYFYTHFKVFFPTPFPRHS